MKIEITGKTLWNLMPLWFWIACWGCAYGASVAHEADNGFLAFMSGAHSVLFFLLTLAAIGVITND